MVWKTQDEIERDAQQREQEDRLAVIKKDKLEALRDQFACAALPAIITLNGNSTSAEEDAVIAYNYATAMLKTRGGSDE